MMNMLTLTEENTLRATIELLTVMIQADFGPINRAYLAETRDRLTLIELEYTE